MLLITTTTACAQFNIKIGSGTTFRKDTTDQTVLMVQHGVLVCGRDKAQAMERVQLLEKICERKDVYKRQILYSTG